MKKETRIEKRLDDLGVLPEPDPDKPIRPTIKGEQKLHHVMDHKMMIPILAIIGILVIAIGIYSYMNTSEEVYIEAAAGPAPPSRPDMTEAGAGGTMARPGYCTQYVSQGEYGSEDDCFAALAEKNTNPDYCLGIVDTQMKDDCLNWIAEEFLDIDTCFRLGLAADIDECLFNIALDTSDMEICFEMTSGDGEFSENHCLFKIAEKDRDPEVCGFMVEAEEPYTQERCVSAAKAAGVRT